MQSRLLYASQQADNERQQERLQFLRRCGLADGMTFQTWQQDTPARRKAAAWARRLTQRIAAGLWSYWHGPYGCGKTHLANAIATELVLEHGIGVRVVNWMVQLRAVQQSWSDNGIQEGPLWDLMIKPHALFLDDFDKQLPRLVDLDKPQVRLPASWYMESLYYVIEMRTAAKRPTVLIANQPLADIVTVLQAVGGTAVDAVFSRFSRAGSITIDWSQTGLTEFVRPAELPEF